MIPYPPLAPYEVAHLFGTLVAETILAGIHGRAHQQAGYMDASDLKDTAKHLARRGRPTYGGCLSKGPIPMIEKFGAVLGAGVVAIALAAAPPVAAQVLTGDAVAGQKLAQEWCSGCHAVNPRDTQVRDNVPSFFSIASMPSTTSFSLQAWLQTSHPRMPDWELTRPQIADVVAYILSLKSETLH